MERLDSQTKVYQNLTGICVHRHNVGSLEQLKLAQLDTFERVAEKKTAKRSARCAMWNYRCPRIEIRGRLRHLGKGASVGPNSNSEFPPVTGPT